VNNTIWSIAVNNIPEGTWRWGVYCNDSAGNEDWSDTNRTFTIDTTKPTLTIVSPTNTTYTQDWVWGNVSIDETADWCGYSLNKTSNITMTNLNNTYWYYNISNLTEEQHNITFYCNDTAGNMNNTETLYFTVDLPPVVTLKSPADGYTRTSDRTITFICSAYDNINLINITLYTNRTGTFASESTNSSPANDTNTTFIISHADNNEYIWNCYACDNISSCRWASSNWTYTIDYTPPRTGTGGGSWTYETLPSETEEELLLTCGNYQIYGISKSYPTILKAPIGGYTPRKTITIYNENITQFFTLNFSNELAEICGFLVYDNNPLPPNEYRDYQIACRLNENKTMNGSIIIATDTGCYDEYNLSIQPITTLFEAIGYLPESGRENFMSLMKTRIGFGEWELSVWQIVVIGSLIAVAIIWLAKK
jgi:hypothetical protein